MAPSLVLFFVFTDRDGHPAPSGGWRVAWTRDPSALLLYDIYRPCRFQLTAATPRVLALPAAPPGLPPLRPLLLPPPLPLAPMVLLQQAGVPGVGLVTDSLDN